MGCHISFHKFGSACLYRVRLLSSRIGFNGGVSQIRRAGGTRTDALFLQSCLARWNSRMDCESASKQDLRNSLHSEPCFSRGEQLPTDEAMQAGPELTIPAVRHVCTTHASEEWFLPFPCLSSPGPLVQPYTGLCPFWHYRGSTLECIVCFSAYCELSETLQMGLMITAYSPSTPLQLISGRYL